MDKGNLLLAIVTLALFTVFIALVGAKFTPSGTASQPVNPQLPTPSCTALRDLPVPSAPIKQSINSAKIFGKVITYDMANQASYPQPNLIILNMGEDNRLYTSDDKPLQKIEETNGVNVQDFDLSNETLVWIQDSTGLTSPILKRCLLDSCNSNTSSNIFYTDNQYTLPDIGNLESRVSISGSKIAWVVLDSTNSIIRKIMFCDLNKNNYTGGCISTDKKQIINPIIQQQNEYIKKLKITENFGYVLTETSATPNSTTKLYILNFNNLTASIYYDEAKDISLIKEFEPIQIEKQSFSDALYVWDDENVSISFIENGMESFKKRTPLLTNKMVETFTAERDTKNLFEIAWKEKDIKNSQYYLKKLSPPKSHLLDNTTYEKINGMSYSKNNFLINNLNGSYKYTYCD